MPKGLKGKKRPVDVTGRAVHVMQIAIGAIEKALPPSIKTVRAAVGHRGAVGPAQKTTGARRMEIAKWK
jgi:hypothetical protein